MKRLFVFAFVAVFLSMVSFAEEPEPKTMAEQFLNVLSQGNVSGAYDGLFSGSQIPEQKPQMAEMLKRQTEMGLPVYGQILGYELYIEEQFGGSVVRLVYIMQLQMHPLFWEFYFYKPGQGPWRLINVAFNDEFAVLSAKK